MTASLEEQKRALELEKLRLELQEKQQALVKGRAETLAGALPDLSAARWSTTSTADGGAVLGAPLAARAVEAAAAKVRAAVEGVLDSNTYAVVVSVEPDFAARQAAHDLLLDRIQGLTRSLRAALAAEEGQGERDDRWALGASVLLGATALAPLVGKALGAAFSLARVTNTLSSTAGSVSDRTAAWAVAGALADASKSAQVYLDGLLPHLDDGPVEAALDGMLGAMDELRGRIVELGKDDPARAPLETLLASCVEVESALHTAPESGLSPLAQAKTYEWIRGNNVPVVVVRGGATSVDQLIRERITTKVTVVAAASIDYLLVDPAAGWRVRKAGLAPGRVQMTGSIGGVLTDAPR